MYVKVELRYLIFRCILTRSCRKRKGEVKIRSHAIVRADLSRKANQETFGREPSDFNSFIVTVTMKLNYNLGFQQFTLDVWSGTVETAKVNVSSCHYTHHPTLGEKDSYDIKFYNSLITSFCFLSKYTSIHILVLRVV